MLDLSEGDGEQLGEIKKQKEMEKRQYDRMRRIIPPGDAGRCAGVP